MDFILPTLLHPLIFALLIRLATTLSTNSALPLLSLLLCLLLSSVVRIRSNHRIAGTAGAAPPWGSFTGLSKALSVSLSVLGGLGWASLSIASILPVLPLSTLALAFQLDFLFTVLMFPFRFPRMPWLRFVGSLFVGSLLALFAVFIQPTSLSWIAFTAATLAPLAFVARREVHLHWGFSPAVYEPFDPSSGLPNTAPRPESVSTPPSSFSMDRLDLLVRSGLVDSLVIPGSTMQSTARLATFDSGFALIFSIPAVFITPLPSAIEQPAVLIAAVIFAAVLLASAPLVTFWALQRNTLPPIATVLLIRTVPQTVVMCVSSLFLGDSFPVTWILVSFLCQGLLVFLLHDAHEQATVERLTAKVRSVLSGHLTSQDLAVFAKTLASLSRAETKKLLFDMLSTKGACLRGNIQIETPPLVSAAPLQREDVEQPEQDRVQQRLRFAHSMIPQQVTKVGDFPKVTRVTRPAVSNPKTRALVRKEEKTVKLPTAQRFNTFGEFSSMRDGSKFVRFGSTVVSAAGAPLGSTTALPSEVTALPSVESEEEEEFLERMESGEALVKELKASEGAEHVDAPEPAVFGSTQVHMVRTPRRRKRSVMEAAEESPPKPPSEPAASSPLPMTPDESMASESLDTPHPTSSRPTVAAGIQLFVVSATPRAGPVSDGSQGAMSAVAVNVKEGMPPTPRR